jgi:hypothetical protein
MGKKRRSEFTNVWLLAFTSRCLGRMQLVKADAEFKIARKIEFGKYCTFLSFNREHLFLYLTREVLFPPKMSGPTCKNHYCCHWNMQGAIDIQAVPKRIAGFQIRIYFVYNEITILLGTLCIPSRDCNQQNAATMWKLEVRPDKEHKWGSTYNSMP